jgi:hypothetical protein
LQALGLNTLTPDQASLPVRMRVIAEAAFSPPSKIVIHLFPLNIPQELSSRPGAILLRILTDILIWSTPIPVDLIFHFSDFCNIAFLRDCYENIQGTV